MQVLIAPEGQPTSDRRLLEPGSLTWRDSIPLMFTDRATHGPGTNTPETVLVGNITDMRRETIDGVTWIVGTATYDTDEEAREAERLATDGTLASVSLDGAAAESIVEITGVDEYGDPVDWLERVTSMEIVGVTQVPMPAFAGARLVTDQEYTTLRPPRQMDENIGLVAAGTWRPPRSWFEMPEPDMPTPLTVLPNGQFYGHAANDWSQCHVGFADVCIPPPKSPTGYARFNRRTIVCEDGSEVEAGNVTMGIGHADIMLAAQPASQHYDNTNAIVGYGRMIDGKIAPWVCGAIRPDLPADRVEQFARVGLSGDWRDEGNGLDMVACLAVPVEGFPVLRARVASGVPQALVASGPQPLSRDDMVAQALGLLVREVGELRAELADVRAPILRERAKAIAASI